MKVIGLTGNIASGKSLVASIFEKLGAKVIDVDDIARQIVEPEKMVWKEIVDNFGKGVLNPDKTINRKNLGDLVFKDEGKRAVLNNITHPRIISIVRDKVKEFGDQDVQLVVIEAALIVEKGGLKDLIDKLVVVISDEQTQFDRLTKRDGLSEEEAITRIKSQMPADKKMQYADYIIDNSGTLENTRQQVDRLWRELAE